MDIIRDLVEKKFKKVQGPEFSPGDTVKVYVRIAEGEKTRVQVFEGVVMQTRKGGLDATFTVRKISNGVGVERVFPYYSPAIEKVEVVTQGSTRRARLFYLRNLEGKAARIDSTLVSTPAATTPAPAAQ